MKRVAAAFVLASLAVLIWRWSLERPPSPDLVAPLENLQALTGSTPSAEQPPTRREPKSRTITASPPPSTNEATVDTPIDDTIPYELVGNLAVWAGDVVIGEVEPGSPKRGWAEAPSVKVWQPGTIPYTIDSDLVDPERVERAISYLRKVTPLEFVALDDQQHGLFFITTNEGCRSYLGQQETVQPVFLSPRCSTGAVIHEILHAIGFVHEQMRTDRDDHVQVLWENIVEAQHPQFRRVGSSFMDASGLADFDFRSIMLYDPRLFAKGNGPTLRSRGREEIAPETERLSAADIERLNRLYLR